MKKTGKMKVGSLFDGSGGFPLAATMCGIKPSWAAEVEPYPIAVTRSRFPSMKHLGDVTVDVTATLRAEAHHPPVVMDAAGFCTEHSSKSRSIGYEEGKSPTLRAGVVPATVYENHSQDTRYVGPLEVAPTVAATYGTGGNNQPFVIRDEAPKTLKIRSGCEGGGKGALIQEDMSATLSCNNDQTVFVPRVYGICAKDSNAMKSANPHSGFYEAATSRTLDGNGGNPTCNQGGVAIVESYAIQGSMIGRADKNGPQGDGINEDVSFTLNTVDRHAVATPTFCSSKASFFTQAEEELANTLVATDYKDPPVINGSKYHVAEEIADVRIMLCQLGIIMGCGNEADEWEAIKIKRLKSKLG